MKILIILFSILIVSILRDSYKEGVAKSGIVDVTGLYTIEYTNYTLVDSITISETEKEIFNSLKSSVDTEYQLYVVGGWIRDKVTFY
jgi:hypothetical protein